MQKGDDVMVWQDELMRNLALGTNLLVIWGNTGDFQKNMKGDYVTLDQELAEEYFRQRMVILYSISTGIRFPNEDMEKIFRQQYLLEDQSMAPRTTAAQNKAIGVQQRSANELSIDELIGGKTPEIVLPLLARIMRDNLLVSRIEKKTAEKLDISGNILKKVVIISFAHNLVPAASAHQSIQDRLVVETLERLAQDRDVGATGNTMILITPNIGDLAEPLRSTQTDIPAIRIPKPNMEERVKLWQELIGQKRINVESNVNAQMLGICTSGLSVKQIKGIYEQASYSKVPLSLDLIKEEKKTILEKEFGDRVKIKIPKWGFNYFGGKENVKRYLREVNDNILAGMMRRVPMGILAAGPPGTGKTFLFECWAFECGFNFVEIQNPRNMYVGESERYMQMILACLEDLAPVIVVEDEADQSEGGRDAYNGDSGVSNRLRQKKFEFCSRPDIRGKVIWVRITNRPDLVDPAYKRKGRSDEIIPFGLPIENEYPNIFSVMFARYGIPTEIRDFSKFARLLVEKKYVTGADVEWMVLEADRISAREGGASVREANLYQAIEEWERSLDPQEINKQIVLAIRGSSKHLRPENWEKILNDAEAELNGAGSGVKT
ncbi:MAG: ATP-binding protein [Candidatus Paceibacterota bacterium]|jgi:SpoVK/Ycf46/Vps4 family AAA+-type ATPase